MSLFTAASAITLIHKTIEHINDGTQLVYLGSCGGAVKLDEVNQKAGDAQIVATKGTGTHRVNALENESTYG